MTTPIVPNPDSADNLKRCTKCGEVKPRTAEYFPKDSTRLRATCRVCAAAETRAWYAKNAEYARERARNYRQQHSEETRAYHARYREENAVRLREERKARYHADSEAARQKQRDYLKANPERAREYSRRNYERHREARNAYNRAYWAEHSEELKAKNRAWYADNHEHMRAYELGRRDSRKEYKREYNLAYYKTERGKNSMKAYRHRRRAKIRSGRCIGADLTTIRAAQTDKLGRLICWACGKPITDKPHLDHWIPLEKGGAHDAGNLHYMHAKCNLSKGSKHPTELGRLL